MNPLNVSFLQELLTSVGERGRALIGSTLFSAEKDASLEALVDALMSVRGEASGVALAAQLLGRYQDSEDAARLSFFQYLATSLVPDAARVLEAAKSYVSLPDDVALAGLRKSLQSPLTEFFRRLNLAPGATAAIVSMRCDLLRMIKDEPALQRVDDDLKRLLHFWFNRGFLVMRRIDWQTPAAILEKIIAYEAVHAIDGWDDLRRRLEHTDRRCFAFFHPSLVDEPLIFVAVALMDDVPAAIEPVLRADPEDANSEPTTAVFYSISNCQRGLKGITFGNFLLKQVVEELAADVPSLKTFVTLSPVPGFAAWLAGVRANDGEHILLPEDREALSRFDASVVPDAEDDALRSSVMALATHYFLRAKGKGDRPVDPVARFHLGNGARLMRINWFGDNSPKGLQESHGLMVNYEYDLGEIEKNHEAYVNDGEIAASRAVRARLRGSGGTMWGGGAARAEDAPQLPQKAEPDA